MTKPAIDTVEMFKKVHVIINPVAGKPRPVLHMLNTVFHAGGVEWDISVTKAAGDVRPFVEHAKKNNVDAVVVYGGDGTVMSVASALVGSDIPLVILPGGTGNVLAVELGIPLNIMRACQLFFRTSHTIRRIDMGQVGNTYFLLRISSGFEAELVKGADRKLKTNVGLLAYALSGFRAALNTRPTTYHVVLDGKKIDCEGLSYVIANSGNLGLPGVTLSSKINIADGLLDVFILRKADLQTLFSRNTSIADQSLIPEFFQHWQAKEVSITADPPQNVHCDGELWGPVPVSARVIPHAVNIVVTKTRRRFWDLFRT